jgi:hypothetical protein
MEETEKRSDRHIRDPVAHTAFKGLVANEIGCARISVMAGEQLSLRGPNTDEQWTNCLQTFKLACNARPASVPAGPATVLLRRQHAARVNKPDVDQLQETQMRRHWRTGEKSTLRSNRWFPSRRLARHWPVSKARITDSARIAERRLRIWTKPYRIARRAKSPLRLPRNSSSFSRSSSGSPRRFAFVADLLSPREGMAHWPRYRRHYPDQRFSPSGRNIATGRRWPRSAFCRAGSEGLQGGQAFP